MDPSVVTAVATSPQKDIGPQDFPGSGENADALGVVAIIPLFLLTHHRLKATIDNCLTTENSADCNFSPEIFLPLVEKIKVAFVIKSYDDDDLCDSDI